MSVGVAEFDGAGAARELSSTRGPVVTFAQLRSDIGRQRKWVAAAAVAGLLLGSAGALLTPRTYTTNTVVSLYALPDNPLQSSAPRPVNPATERQVAQSNDIVEYVVTQVPGLTPGRVRDSLAVEVPVNSAALRFAFTDTDPERAAQAADAAAQGYLGLRNEAYQETVESAVAGTEAQIVALEKEQIEVQETVSLTPEGPERARAQLRYDQIGALLGQLRGQSASLQAVSEIGGRVTGKAPVPTVADGLSLLGWMSAGGAFGLLIGLVLTVTRGQLDRRIHTRAHLEAVSGLRTLADLSTSDQDLEQAAALLLAHHRTESISPLVLSGCAVGQSRTTVSDLAKEMRSYGATVEIISTSEILTALEDAEIHLVDAMSVGKGEALLWGAASNGVVIVTRQSVTTFADIAEMMRELQSLGVPMLGTILLARHDREPVSPSLSQPGRRRRSAAITVVTPSRSRSR